MTTSHRLRRQLGKLNIKQDSGCLTLFEKYLNTCEQNHIKVIFVYSPEYIDGQHFVENRDEILGTYRRIASRHSIPFFDYSSDSISLDRSFFYNASHLNKRGAEVFTNKLARDLDGLVEGYFEK